MCACQLCLHSLPMSAGFEIKNAGKNQLWWVTPSNHLPIWRVMFTCFAGEICVSQILNS